MLNLGLMELIFLSVLALIVLGPKRLPEVAVRVGRFLNEMKRTTEDVSSAFREPLDSINKEAPNKKSRKNNEPKKDE